MHQTLVKDHPTSHMLFGPKRKAIRRENERRKDRRYHLSLPVSIFCPDRSRVDLQTGHTRDISGQGLYCVADQDLVVGTAVELIITLWSAVGRRRAVSLRARGRVIRIDKLSKNDRKNRGVATFVESYEFVRG